MIARASTLFLPSDEMAHFATPSFR
jgi:hypothetical protein